MKVMRQSSLTGETNVREISITIEQYIAWQDADDSDENRFVQNAFPHLPADDREFLVSGITPEEWDNAFGDYDDEDENYDV